jgi:hypothetical protein
MSKIYPHFLAMLICAFVLSLSQGMNLSAAPPDSTQDSIRTDSVKTVPGMYENVDVIIVYPWKEDEPETCENVTCQLIKENQVPVELRIFHKDCTDKLKIKPGSLTFKIVDHKTKKLIAKGP